MRKATSTVAEQAGENTRPAFFAIRGFGCPLITIEAYSDKEACRVYKEMNAISLSRPDELMEVRRV